jgi:hypothetical protein
MKFLVVSNSKHLVPPDVMTDGYRSTMRRLNRPGDLPVLKVGEAL